jgi:hypothetical protein
MALSFHGVLDHAVGDTMTQLFAEGSIHNLADLPDHGRVEPAAVDLPRWSRVFARGPPGRHDVADAHGHLAAVRVECLSDFAQQGAVVIPAGSIQALVVHVDAVVTVVPGALKVSGDQFRAFLWRRELVPIVSPDATRK